MDSSYKKELKKFIKEQLDKGYFKEEIINHLVAHGHREEDAIAVFDDSFENEESQNEYLKEHSKLIVISSWIVFIGILIILSGLSTRAPGTAVMIGFLPSILTLIYCAISLDNHNLKKNIWVMPAVFAIILMSIELIGATDILKGMAAIKLALLNIFIGYAIVVTFKTVIKEEHHYSHVEHELNPENAKEKKQKEKHISKEINTIEDKLKALNFVIGRVYQARNGATKDMRDKINFPPELYNGLHEAIKEKNHEKIQEWAKKIESRLNTLNEPEENIFGKLHLINLERDHHGTDNIIEVLSKNDKDPVVSYFEEAMDIIREIKEIYK